MPREKRVTALIIKKQPLGEADELITLFSLEEGKFRAVTKSSKLSTSKMQYALQPLFVVDATLTGASGLPKLIRSQIQESHAALYNHPDRVALWFVVAELLIKLLPDEEPNNPLYYATRALLSFLNSNEDIQEHTLQLALIKYKISAMDLTGLGVHTPHIETSAHHPLFFSTSRGGFYEESLTTSPSADARPVSDQLWQGFLQLRQNFEDYETLPQEPPIWLEQLDGIMKDFVSYQLEREIKAEKFFKTQR